MIPEVYARFVGIVGGRPGGGKQSLRLAMGAEVLSGYFELSSLQRLMPIERSPPPIDTPPISSEQIFPCG
jgi:hypothetical protein